MPDDGLIMQEAERKISRVKQVYYFALILPPEQQSCWGVYWFHSVRPSVRLSVPAAVSAL